ncbi:MAG: AEC family transporter [Acetobacteraceae bacterium]|nr:AEC family transporter [Acetobacteraceae bacterium]
MNAGKLFAIIAPIFAMIGMGQLAVRFRFVDKAGLRGLNDLVFFAGLPALLFRSVVEAPTFSVLAIASAYFTAGLVVYGVAFAFSLFAFRMGLARAAMIGLNASYGNTVLMGVPVVAGVYGQDGLSSLLGIISLQSVVFLPMTTVLIEIGGKRQTNLRNLLRITVFGVIRNPIILSIFSALLWRAAGIPVPDALDGWLNMLGAAGPPVALFCLGASLPLVKMGGVALEALFCSLLKLIAMPLLVWTVARAAGLSGLPLAVAIMTGALPTGANAFMIARRAETGLEASAATVVLATAVFPVTLALVLAATR